MNANQQSAIAALNAVRPIAARLDRSRDGEDRAADILELWEGTETALRALMGGSSLGGQALIRELRQRELISLGQAYGLLEFLGARDRANRTSYKSTPSDVDAAREGFRQLDTGLSQGTIDGTSSASEASAPPARTAATLTPTPAAGATVPTPATTPAPASSRVPLMQGRNKWLIPAIVGLLVVAGLLYALLGRPTTDSAMTKGVDLMKAGSREAARTQFAAVARDNPTLATPHVFLARLSREEGDLGTARSEAEKAVRLEPTNAVALREMGLVLFTTRQYSLSRNFFIRALKASPNDSASKGYLGCALMQTGGNVALGEKFIREAGPGVWTSCANLAGPPPNP